MIIQYHACQYRCGTLIFFLSYIKDYTGKPIPLEATDDPKTDGRYHRCLKRRQFLEHNAIWDAKRLLQAKSVG
jgi:hypothetical protein